MIRAARDSTARSPSPPGEPVAARVQALVARHLVAGWILLLVYLSLGIVLDALHGFKIGWYVDLSSQTRRLMWTLAHAHGVLLGLVNIAFAITVFLAPTASPHRRQGSSLLLGASILLPGGFFLGGIGIHGGDPGVGVFLTPIGALLLFAAAAIAILEARNARR